jgi:hypothetical protein
MTREQAIAYRRLAAKLARSISYEHAHHRPVIPAGVRFTTVKSDCSQLRPNRPSTPSRSQRKSPGLGRERCAWRRGFHKPAQSSRSPVSLLGTDARPGLRVVPLLSRWNRWAPLDSVNARPIGAVRFRGPQEQNRTGAWCRCFLVGTVGRPSTVSTPDPLGWPIGQVVLLPQSSPRRMGSS